MSKSFRLFVLFVKLNEKNFFAQRQLEMLARSGRNSKLALLGRLKIVVHSHVTCGV